MNGQPSTTAWLRHWVALLALAALTGCANLYVDGQLKDVDASTFRKTDPAHPVQVLFEFQTKGVSNAAATGLLRAAVFDQVKASGVFSEVSEGPVAGASLLTITLNNVPITDDAFAKGFVTGLTLGLAGSQVSDGYICTASYVGPGAASAITKSARHAIHATIGNASAPSNAIKATSQLAAITTMTHQVLSNVLNDVTQDAGFK